MKNRNSIIKAILACALIGSCAVMSGRAQNCASYFVARTATSGAACSISTSVMMSLSITSGIPEKASALSADDIIYLNGQGVSQKVIRMPLQTTVPPIPLRHCLWIHNLPFRRHPTLLPSLALASAPAAAGPPVASTTPTMDYLIAQHTPNRSWVDVPGYGMCWQPAVDFGWRPYFDQGHWEYTDAGWYWQSDYPWGDIAFHYGRWTYGASGWIWAPGYEYAPAWVVWRHA